MSTSSAASALLGRVCGHAHDEGARTSPGADLGQQPGRAHRLAVLEALAVGGGRNRVAAEAERSKPGLGRRQLAVEGGLKLARRR